MLHICLACQVILLSVARNSSVNDTIVVKPESVELEETWEGESVNVSFQIHNVSKKPVQLGKILKSCSCVETKISAGTVQPGDQVQLDVKLVHNRPGEFNESVLIHTAQDEAQETMVKITGKAKPAYIVRATWESKDRSQAGLETMASGKVCRLADVREGTEPGLLVHIDGLREKDPMAKCNSVAVTSSVFRLLQHQVKPLPNGRSQCALRLGFTSNLDQGLYSDRLEFAFGPDLKLSRRVSFRVVGPVWPERAVLNLGTVRANGKTEKITLHFEPDVAVWNEVQVVSTDPAHFHKAIVPLSVTRNPDGRSAVVCLAVDHAQLATVARNYFHFTLWLGDKKDAGAKRAAHKGNIPTAKLHVCGIVVGASGT